MPEPGKKRKASRLVRILNVLTVVALLAAVFSIRKLVNELR
jgi:hypothetical protein